MVNLERADGGRRVAARVVDLVLSFGIGGFLGILWVDYEDGRDAEAGAFYLILGLLAIMVLFMVVYEIGFLAWRGQTPGKMLAKVRVVRYGSGGRIGVGRAILRLLPLFLAVIPAVGWIVAAVAYGWFLVDDEGRGWHDKLAGTEVISA